MQCVYRKIKRDNGESLAEVMVAILITAIGMLMLSSLIYAASHMIEKGDARIKTIYNGVNAMEEKKETTITNKELTISRTTGSVQINIDIYEDKESGLLSYKKHEGSK